jgi:hypothetical protein
METTDTPAIPAADPHALPSAGTEAVPPPAAGDANVDEYDAEGQDALHILPLRIIPLETPGLRRLRLIKNVRLDSVVELYKDQGHKSAQVPLDALHSVFQSYAEPLRKDMPLLQSLSSIPSFDVYTLRVALRALNLSIDMKKELQLSDGKRKELTEHMKVFTHPLIQQIYGSDDFVVNDVSDIMKLIASPNREDALKNLRMMSQKLNVPLTEIPRFLEDYGDTFLSLAYFRSCLDLVVPQVQGFLDWLKPLEENQMIKQDRMSKQMLDKVKGSLSGVIISLTGRFEAFNRKSADFWKDINADSFAKMKDLVFSNHRSIGGVLCGLSVKMQLWRDRFPTASGGPNKRLEFVRSEIVPGMQLIDELEAAARKRGI